MAFVAITMNQAQNFPTSSWSDVADTGWYDASQDEFTISTAEELAGVSQLVIDGNTFAGKTFNINADIDLNGNLWTAIGVDNHFPFSGTVLGNGHVISNLWINLPVDDFIGIFGYTESASLKDIHIDTANIVGLDNVGTLVANLFNNGLVENCSAINVSVTGNNSTGGLVGGFLTNSTISKSHAIGDVSGGTQVGGLVGTGWDQSKIQECYSEGTVNGTFLVGGLIGAFPFAFTAPSTVTDCYSRSSVAAVEERAGGIIGGADNAFALSNAYSTGTVSATDFAGAVIGFVGGGITIENTYFDTESSGMTEGVGGFGGTPSTPDITGKTTAEMKTSEMVDLLNAGAPDGPWSIDSSVNDGYPVLNFVLSIAQNQLDANSIVIYPTVFENTLTVSSAFPLTAYGIFNNAGAIVSEGKMDGETTDISAASLSSGVYFIRIDTANGSVVKRVIKK